MAQQAWTALHLGHRWTSARDIGDRTHPRGHRAHRLGTITFAGLYLGSGVFNGLVTVRDALEVFESFRDMAWLAPYSWLIDDVILSAPTASAVVLAGFELAVGGAILAGGRARRAGLLAATAFVVGLIPSLSWPYWTANVGLAALQLALLRRGSK